MRHIYCGNTNRLLCWQGFATETCQVICQYAIEKLGMERLISIIEPSNVRSVRVAERLGMAVLKETKFHGYVVRVYSLRKGGQLADLGGSLKR